MDVSYIPCYSVHDDATNVVYYLVILLNTKLFDSSKWTLKSKAVGGEIQTNHIITYKQSCTSRPCLETKRWEEIHVVGNIESICHCSGKPKEESLDNRNESQSQREWIIPAIVIMDK